MLMSGRSQHNTVKQLFSNLKKWIKKKNKKAQLKNQAHSALSEPAENLKALSSSGWRGKWVPF